MVAYEFYQRDKEGNSHLIGILPERRKGPERINHESIMKWLATFLDREAIGDNVYFIQVEVCRENLGSTDFL